MTYKFSYTTYNLLKKLKQHIIFLKCHIIFKQLNDM